MENLITRYRNVTILVAVLFAQVLGLAVQVKRTTENESTRLIRIWTINAVTPLEKGIVRVQTGSANLWHEYFYLRGVRRENRDLKQEIERLRLEQVRLNDDAQQAHRLQALLGFQEQFISKTMAAQVIGSSGSGLSRSIYIDKGARDGIKPDMAVITADGVVGKVLRVFGARAYEASTSQILLIDDQSSGVGAILEKSRLQGVVRGNASGGVMMENVMADEVVNPGEKVLTSGGDQVFPKGLAIGTVMAAAKGPETFLNIRVKPTADLSRLEEVLVVIQKAETQPVVAETGPVRAVDILAERLPSVPDKPPDPAKPGTPGGTAAASSTGAPKTPALGVIPTGTGTTAAGNPPASRPQVASVPEAGDGVKPVNRSSGQNSAKPGVIKSATAQNPLPQPLAVSDKSTKPAAPKAKPLTAPAGDPPPGEPPQ